MPRDPIRDDTAALKETNAKLKQSLSKCRALLDECRSKLVANSNEAPAADVSAHSADG